MTLLDRIMKFLFLTAIIVDIALGLVCVFFAGWVEVLLDLPVSKEPVFIRIVGLFPIFVGYLYYLIFTDQKKYLILIQVTVVERFLYPILLSVELFYLLPPPFSLIHIAFIVMALITLFLALMQVYYLKRLNQRIVLLN